MESPDILTYAEIRSDYCVEEIFLFLVKYFQLFNFIFMKK